MARGMKKIDLAVLGALWLEGGSAFGFELVKRGISAGRLYPALKRLEDAGKVSRSWSALLDRAVYSLVP